jgi:hypothetical protein
VLPGALLAMTAGSYLGVELAQLGHCVVCVCVCVVCLN